MSEIQLVLIILGGAFALWQIVLLTAFVGMLVNPNYTKVKVGILPGIIALILFIAAVFV